jgi:hypothetical protein
MNTKTATGSITANGQAVTMSVDDLDEVSVQASGTFTATLTFEVSVDNGANYIGLAMVSYASTTPGTPVLTATAAGAFYARNVTTATHVRVRCTAYTSGTAVVTIVGGRLGRS